MKFCCGLNEIARSSGQASPAADIWQAFYLIPVRSDRNLSVLTSGDRRYCSALYVLSNAPPYSIRPRSNY
ncbi:MAG: hypothetical protein HC849_02805 [Oscillatoriales cyanobacterium RU_3_3]|nr:hypothetical protein [Oscillatoriales cyanobacterium RU_3_3]